MIEKIKTILSRILPKKVFNFLILMRRKTYVARKNRKYNQKLSWFKKWIFKEIKYKNIKYFLKISPKNGHIDNEIYLYGIYEKDTYEFMYNTVKKWDICVDVWANIWVFTNFLPQLVWEKWKVFWFEPIKRVYQQNLESIKKNGYKNVKLFNYACSDKETDTKIHVNNENIGASSIINSNAWKWSHIETIKTIILDDLLSSEKKIDFMKIDTEWFELNVLKWALWTIEKHHPKIFMEFIPSLHKEQGDWKDILELIEKYYSNVYILESKKTLNLNEAKWHSEFLWLLRWEWVNILMY